MSNNEIPLESFTALSRRARALCNKIIITEGDSDRLVYHHYSPESSGNIICRSINTIKMPNSGMGNVGQITSNIESIASREHISAIIDLDKKVYMSESCQSQSAYLQELSSAGIFASCGYAIENYSLCDLVLLKDNFYDCCGIDSNVSNWNELAQKSITCYSLLSRCYFLFSKESLCNYKEVRSIGNEFFQSIKKNEVNSDSYLVHLRLILENAGCDESIISSVFDDIDDVSWKEIDCKLIEPCIKLIFHGCGCTQPSDLKQRIAAFIGRYEKALHMTRAIDYLTAPP